MGNCQTMNFLDIRWQKTHLSPNKLVFFCSRLGVSNVYCMNHFPFLNHIPQPTSYGQQYWYNNQKMVTELINGILLQHSFLLIIISPFNVALNSPNLRLLSSSPSMLLELLQKSFLQRPQGTYNPYETFHAFIATQFDVSASPKQLQIAVMLKTQLNALFWSMIWSMNITQMMSTLRFVTSLTLFCIFLEPNIKSS